MSRAASGPDRSPPEDRLAFFAGKVAKWGVPDDVRFVSHLPHGATGKLDKAGLGRDLLPPVPSA